MSDASKHARFYIDTVTFRVEDCLFKVPREPFEKESAIFGNMFLLPTGDTKEQGQSYDDPVHLPGTSKDDFEQLLSVLLHRTYCTSQKPLPEATHQWLSVLKLAVLWKFDGIRTCAMKSLMTMLPPSDRIALGQIYSLDFESWTLPAMNEIVNRQKSITLEEGQEMGLDTSLKLASVREQFMFTRNHIVPSPRPNVRYVDSMPVLRKTFGGVEGSTV